jgi:hypothetical protein
MRRFFGCAGSVTAASWCRNLELPVTGDRLLCVLVLTKREIWSVASGLLKHSRVNQPDHKGMISQAATS